MTSRALASLWVIALRDRTVSRLSTWPVFAVVTAWSADQTPELARLMEARRAEAFNPESFGPAASENAPAH
jgi:hypothetical protein